MELPKRECVDWLKKIIIHIPLPADETARQKIVSGMLNTQHNIWELWTNEYDCQHKHYYFRTEFQHRIYVEMRSLAKDYHISLQQYAPELLETIYPLIPDTNNWWEELNEHILTKHSSLYYAYQNEAIDRISGEFEGGEWNRYCTMVAETIEAESHLPAQVIALEEDIIIPKYLFGEWNNDCTNYYSCLDYFDDNVKTHMAWTDELIFVLDSMRRYYRGDTLKWAYAGSDEFDYYGAPEYADILRMPRASHDLVFELYFRYARLLDKKLDKLPILGA